MEPVFRLRRFLKPSPRARRQPEERCEFCGSALLEAHAHVIDLESRRILCSCRPCYLLFTQAGAAGGKFRSVPERYVELPELALDRVRWEAFEIPVGVAFFARQSAADRVAAFYPSPAGATESALPLETWRDLVEAHPAAGTLEPDVEALLVCRKRDPAECWIVPVDACYELVGRIRRYWRGFQGGEEAWREIDSFFDSLRRRAEGRIGAWAI